jgi:hypothetical protein
MKHRGGEVNWMLFRFAVVITLLCFLAPFALGEEQVYVLKKPEPEEEEVRSIYINKELGIGLDLREGFTFIEEEVEEDVFNLSILLEGYPLTAALTVEPLEEELSSEGYWRLMQKRDPNIEKDLVYERAVDVAGTGGLQVRIEGGNHKTHYLILSVIFTSGTNGYIISCFTDQFLYDKVPDFLDDVSGGFYFIEEEGEENVTEVEEPPEVVEDVQPEDGSVQGE